MNTRVKKLWVKALRSGEYVQAHGRLARDGGDYDRFCCLGVLTNIYCEQNGIDFDELTRAEGEVFLPKSVSNWADIPKNPFAGGNTLASHNDRGRSFRRIADLIEKHL